MKARLAEPCAEPKDKFGRLRRVHEGGHGLEQK